MFILFPFFLWKFNKYRNCAIFLHPLPLHFTSLLLLLLLLIPSSLFPTPILPLPHFFLYSLFTSILPLPPPLPPPSNSLPLCSSFSNASSSPPPPHFILSFSSSSPPHFLTKPGLDYYPYYNQFLKHDRDK